MLHIPHMVMLHNSRTIVTAMGEEVMNEVTENGFRLESCVYVRSCDWYPLLL